MELREYQKTLAKEATDKLSAYGIVYLSMEVRTGKTLTALQVANLGAYRNVLFITKKKAITSIQSDYEKFGFDYQLTVINNESLHKIEGDFDLIISDEHHRNGAMPKPNIVTRLIRQRYKHLPMIFLSGTPTPETYSQIYHQFWVSDRSPFKKYINFYKWAKDYVNVTEKHLGYAVVKDYSDAKIELIKKEIEKYMTSYTQNEAGFESSIDERFLMVHMNSKTHAIAERLEKDRVVEGKEDAILAETAVKLMQKLHQIYSGTCILESGKGMVFDYSKALKIRDEFKGKKIAIFYKFKQEFEAIKEVFKDNITDSIEDFDSTDKNIALQIVSGREGISLRNADFIVFYNIDFSAVSYWQARDRMTTMERKNNTVYWCFSVGGIEQKIYNAVMSKRDYTLSHFRKDFNVRK